MKPFALSVLYVFSIVLAVGIGMYQVGKEHVLFGSEERPDCEVVLDSPVCIGEQGCSNYTYMKVDDDKSRTFKTVLAPTVTYGAPSSQQCYQENKVCFTKGTLTLDTSPCNQKNN